MPEYNPLEFAKECFEISGDKVPIFIDNIVETYAAGNALTPKQRTAIDEFFESKGIYIGTPLKVDYSAE